MKFEWKEDTTIYSNGYLCYIKKCLVGGVNWNSTRSKDNTFNNSYVYYSKFNLITDETSDNKEELMKLLEEKTKKFLNYLTKD